MVHGVMLLANLFSSLTCVSAVFFVFSDRGHKPRRPAESAECSPADEPGQSGPQYHWPVWRCRQWVGNHTETLSNSWQHSTSNHPPFRSPPSSLMLHLSSSAGSHPSTPRSSYCPRPVLPPPRPPLPAPIPHPYTQGQVLLVWREL